MLVLFISFVNFFTKILMKGITYCQTVPVGRLLIYAVKIVCQTSLLFFLTWVSLAMFCLDQWLMEIVPSGQQQLSLVDDNSLIQMNLE